ncbi:MAG: GntR family transcriptional regulator [Rhodospirillales bacterium]|nr:GntR family transcriptional regulator [Rhodospirillales bacterium]
MSFSLREIESGTLASTVYEQLRREIVSARLAPGEKLRIEALRARYGVGGSPVREALNRLSAEGLVWQQDQKGFRVSPVSEEELLELTRTRCWINEIALRESIQHGDAAWEEAIILAFHRLSRTPTRLEDGSGMLDPVWEQQHRAFHASLIAACRSRWLLNFAEMLFDCADRYRHLSGKVIPRTPRNVVEEHRAILEATINHKADQAIALLNAHLSKTAELVQRSGIAMPSTATSDRKTVTRGDTRLRPQ